MAPKAKARAMTSGQSVGEILWRELKRFLPAEPNTHISARTPSRLRKNECFSVDYIVG
jgi:hypothetical protein